jgi:gluconate kinase
MEAKKIQVPKMYIFGLAASFNDTIVHFTNVQELDGAWIEKKNNFLQAREQYSSQLRDFLAEEKQMPRRTCIVYANKSRKKVEKKYQKMKRLYMPSKKQHQQYDIRNVEQSEFRFKTIDLQQLYDDVNASE